MQFALQQITRKNIQQLKPYSSARDEFSGEAKVFLDANENSLGSPLIQWYNRYPDPHHVQLRKKIATIKGVAPEHIFIGNGSDECIDVLFRCFSEPGESNTIICPPTYGMYQVSAQINDIAILEAPLLPDYQLNLAHIEQLVNPQTRIIWICSPNNPTGNLMHLEDIETVLNNFSGLVVVDEAYINFARQRSLIALLPDYPNLVVLQTLSKAWGLAGLRIGMAFASREVVEIMNKVKPPYNISEPAQQLAIKALEEVGQVNDMITLLVDMREALAAVFRQMPLVEAVYPSDANFLLVKIQQAHQVYEFLLDKGIVVRDRSRVQLCDDCLRITIGTEQENTLLVDALVAWHEQ
jgi:histidinol-phosphate aminotransferase